MAKVYELTLGRSSGGNGRRSREAGGPGVDTFPGSYDFRLSAFGFRLSLPLETLFIFVSCWISSFIFGFGFSFWDYSYLSFLKVICVYFGFVFLFRFVIRLAYLCFLLLHHYFFHFLIVIYFGFIFLFLFFLHVLFM